MQKREVAIKQGVKIMNTFNKLVNTAVEYTEFDEKDYIVIADIYKEARQELGVLRRTWYPMNQCHKLLILRRWFRSPV